MAAVNRFTNIRANDYNPMSLQELMLVPQYKRTQHDNLLESASAIDTAIAQVDPLAIHNNAARKEQERLYKGVTEQVDLLNTEGFNPSSKSAFLKLNKDFQQSVSPTGTIGRINAAKQILNKNKNEYIENATKQGYSPEAILQNWNDFENRYISRFQKTGNIENIGEMFAPKYYDYIEEGRKLFKDAGISSSDIAGGGGKIVQDENGTYVINTKSRTVNENNVKQLQAAVDFLNNRMMNPNSDAYKSIVHQRKTPNQAIQELTGLADVFVKSSTARQNQSAVNSFTPREEKASSNMFLNHMLKGTNLKAVAEDSPLNSLPQFRNAEFDANGNIIQGQSNYPTYAAKVEAFRKQNNVRFDKETNQYIATPKAVFSAGTGAMNVGTPISKDPHHLKNDLSKIRSENPGLATLSDKDLISRLQSYDENISTEYISSITLPNTNYEYLNDRLFGNRKGKGEKSTGIFLDKGATIDGRQLTASEVIDELGYNSTQEFKEIGNPAIQGYSVALGKWHVAVQDGDGNAVDLFVKDINELDRATELSRKMTQEAFKGKAFSVLGRIDGNTTMYFVNDFVQPKIIVGKSGATNAANIQDVEEELFMSEVVAEEKNSLAKNPLYRSVIGIKDE